MQIVIEIDDYLYKTIKSLGIVVDDGDAVAVSEAIMNGIPLPKGHGDLIDKGIFKKWIETQDGDTLMPEYYLDALDAQETIIDAERSDEE